MKTRIPVLTGLALVATAGLGSTPGYPQQIARLSDRDSLIVSAFISATLYTDRSLFGSFGQGQNAQWAAQNQPAEDRVFTGGDFRNTRMRFDYHGDPTFGAWAPRATLEADFFAPPDLAQPFQDEQPRLRARLAFVDLTNGRTTLRIGQFWAPLFGEVPVSLSHLAFPLGYGASGMIGWRFPGVFLYQELVPGAAQLQLAALTGSGPSTGAMDQAMNIGNGEASGLPQLEAQGAVRKDGKRIAVSLSISPILDASGKVVGANRIADVRQFAKEAGLSKKQTDDLVRAIKNIPDKATTTVDMIGMSAAIDRASLHRRLEELLSIFPEAHLFDRHRLPRLDDPGCGAGHLVGEPEVVAAEEDHFADAAVALLA